MGHRNEKNMSRRNFLKLSAAGTAGLGMGLGLAGCAERISSGQMKRRPNVVVVISDDQGFGDFSCYGNTILKTPNLDSLYEQSTRINNFICTPLCSPTRASVMTGRYNYRTGLWDTWMGRASLHPDEITVADQVSKAGYRTGLFGKWHLGRNFPKRPQDKGFDEVVEPASFERMDPLMAINGRTKKVKGFMDDLFFDYAIDFMKNNQNDPFVCFVTSIMPHDWAPPQVPEEYIEPYRKYSELKPGDQEVYGMVANLDYNVGRLLNALDDLNLADDTVVIFFPDNGPLRCDENLKSRPEQLVCGKREMGARYNVGLRGGKATVYEGGIRVPCFVRWPGKIQQGCDLPVLSGCIDIMPTVLDICNVSLPRSRKIDGISLLPFLTGRNTVFPDRTLFVQNHRVEVPQKWQETAVRGTRYKLINGIELYDIANDPGETKNIAEDHPEIVTKMRKQYENWFEDVSSERGFVPSYDIIGQPGVEMIPLHILFHHSMGWPLRVARSGLYKVTVSGIQHELFPKNGKFCIKFDEKEYCMSIQKDSDVIIFDNIKLKKGDTVFDIWPVGDRTKKLMYYGNEDFGYREIAFERIK